jgi:opacity protein-like surface antigen
MKRIAIGLVAAAVWAGSAAAQDLPGFSVGGFYESRIDNRVDDENLTFDYFGARLQFRDERWFTVFLDVGSQSAEWGDYESDGDSFFGLGGTLWFVRAEDLMVPIDFGAFGSVYKGDLDVDVPGGGGSFSATYTTWTAQGVARLTGYGIARPFVRAGVKGTNLDDFSTENDWEATNPAINAGLEIAPTDQFVLTLEGNYSEGVGFAVRADLWF